MTLKLSEIEAKAKRRPSGYYEDVIGHGIIVENELVLDDEVYAELCLKYGYQAAQRSNLPVVGIDQFKVRKAICVECPEWSGHRCRRCNCAEISLWMVNSKCPIGKW